MKTSNANARLTLHASLDRIDYAAHDEILLEVSLMNAGKRRVEIDRRISPTAHLQLEFRDSAGRTVKSEQIRAQLALSKNRRDFLELAPGYLYGIRLRLLRKQNGPPGAKYYSLIYPPGNEIGEKFFLSSAGGYSLTVVYEGVDDGHMAGVTAWVGTLTSNSLSFKISP